MHVARFTRDRWQFDQSVRVQVVGRDPVGRHDLRRNLVVSDLVAQLSPRLVFRDWRGLAPNQFRVRLFESRDKLLHVGSVVIFGRGQRSIDFVTVTLRFGFGVAVTNVP